MKPSVPGRVRRELKDVVRGRDVDDVALALTLAGDLIDDQDGNGALEYLVWAKSVASRSPSVREALGVAHYLAEDYRGALNELRAYRRLAGSLDQEHLVADCLRALGHPVSDVAATVEALLEAEVHPARQVEGLLVWAGAVADTGDVAGARAVLRRAGRARLEASGEEARWRYAYLAGDLAERAGDVKAAISAFRTLAALDDDPFEVIERLERLERA
jgi:hypothetical protein